MIKLEKARVTDAEDYANILNKSWKDTYGDYISIEHIDDEFNIDKLIKGFKEYIECKEFELYMIKENDINVGIIEFGQYEDKYKENMDEIGEIRSFHIKKEYQGRGIGSKAIKFAINELNKNGYSTICLWVKKQNHRAIEFYKKYDFKITKYGLEETIDGAPSIVLEKELV